MVMSASEIEVRCPLGFPLPSMAGAPVELELFLDDPGGGWLQFRGHVTHVRPLTHSLVVHLDDIPAQLAVVIDAHLSGQLPATDVVVVDEVVDLPSGNVARE